MYKYREIQVQSSLVQIIGNCLSIFNSSQEFCMNGHCSSVSWMWLNSGRLLHLELMFQFFTFTENSTIKSQLRSGWGSVKHEWRFSYVNKIAVNSFNKTSTVIEQQPAHIASFTSSCARLNRQVLGCIPFIFSSPYLPSIIWGLIIVSDGKLCWTNCISLSRSLLDSYWFWGFFVCTS